MSLQAVATTAWSESSGHDPERVASVTIPRIQEGPKRAITTNDLIALRDVDSFSLSPDGKKFAVLLRQADPVANHYRTAWFIGSIDDGWLIHAGDGGEARLSVGLNGRRSGDVVGSPGRWSPDGKWIAYTLQAEGQVQLWRSSADGKVQQQLTRNDADVQQFVWSEDGRALLFTVGSTRESLRARDEKGRRNGFRLDEFQWFSEIIYQATPAWPRETDLTVWIVASDGTGERPANAEEKNQFEKGLRRNWSWGRDPAQVTSVEEFSGAAAPPIVSRTGWSAWLARVDPSQRGFLPVVRMMVSSSPDGSRPIECTAAECTGQVFSKIWWSPDGKRVIFWRDEGANLGDQSLYAWTPANGVVQRLWRSPGDRFTECELVEQRLICVRETRTRPAHVVSIDIHNGHLSVVADFNPEFRNLQMPKVERIEWDAPPDSAQLGYDKRGYGYIIYPPDFDPRKKYPLLISPYMAQGFIRGDVGDEQPLLVYAANGFVVLDTAFLYMWGSFATDPPNAMAPEMASAEHGFPHMTMLMESTLRALDLVQSRGWVDPTRVGMGGLSQGAMASLYTLQKYDRLSAVSVSGPGFSQMEYYAATNRGRAMAASTASDGSWPESADYWSQIDIADHIDAIEAPILLNLADRESMYIMRLQRRLSDARKPFEAYIFPDEYHQKWQPAHRYAIYNRNLDWFRFWLQDYEDPSADKAEQYRRWRELRKLQCANPRSLRNYCPQQKE